MASIRLLHVSDFHFAAVENRAINPLKNPHLSWGQLRSRAAFMASHDSNAKRALANYALLESQSPTLDRPPLDVVVITGDLATTGDAKDLRAARHYLTKPGPGEDIPETLGIPGLDVVFLPGNHDRYHGWPGYIPGNRRFETIFSPPEFAWNRPFGVQVLWQKAVGNQQLVILAADFCLTSNDAYYNNFTRYLGHGRAEQQQVQALVQATLLLRRRTFAETVVIWAIHFDPSVTGYCSLLGGQKLVDAMHQHDIPLVLCGHTHDMNDKPPAKTPPATPPPPPQILCNCGTSMQFGAKRHSACDLLIDMSHAARPTIQRTNLTYRLDSGFGR